MNLARWIDDAMFDYVFQPVCNRLASVSTPKRIALFCVSGLFVADASKAVLDHMSGSPVAGWDWVSLFISIVIYTQASYRPELTGRTRNPQRIMVFSLALRLSSALLSAYDLILLAALPVDLVSVITTWAGFCFMGFLYFEACDKPPPARQRQRAPSGAAPVRGGAS